MFAHSNQTSDLGSKIMTALASQPPTCSLGQRVAWVSISSHQDCPFEHRYSNLSFSAPGFRYSHPMLHNSFAPCLDVRAGVVPPLTCYLNFNLVTKFSITNNCSILSVTFSFLLILSVFFRSSCTELNSLPSLLAPNWLQPNHLSMIY